MNAEKPIIPVIKVYGLPPMGEYKGLRLAIAQVVMNMEIEPIYAGTDVYLVSDMVKKQRIIESNILIEMSFVTQAYVPVLRAIIDHVQSYFSLPVRVRGRITFLNGGSVVM
jgi:hypothetical protein